MNKFKVGDPAISYSITEDNNPMFVKGIITAIDKDLVSFGGTKWHHYKQCRRLVKKSKPISKEEYEKALFEHIEEHRKIAVKEAALNPPPFRRRVSVLGEHLDELMFSNNELYKSAWISKTKLNDDDIEFIEVLPTDK
jgi:hypothetical protein